MPPYHFQGHPCLGRHYRQALKLIITFYLNIILFSFPMVLDRCLLLERQAPSAPGAGTSPCDSVEEQGLLFMTPSHSPWGAGSPRRRRCGGLKEWDPSCTGLLCLSGASHVSPTPNRPSTCRLCICSAYHNHLEHSLCVWHHVAHMKHNSLWLCGVYILVQSLKEQTNK